MGEIAHAVTSNYDWSSLHRKLMRIGLHGVKVHCHTDWAVAIQLQTALGMQ